MTQSLVHLLAEFTTNPNKALAIRIKSHAEKRPMALCLLSPAETKMFNMVISEVN